MKHSVAATWLLAILAPPRSAAFEENHQDVSISLPKLADGSFPGSVELPTSERALQSLTEVDGQVCPVDTAHNSGRRFLQGSSAIIDNGLIKLGIFEGGNLNVPGTVETIPDNYGRTTTQVGLRYIFPDGSGESESTSYGCYCEGWGAYGDGESIFFNADRSPDSGYSIDSFTSTASTAVSTVSKTNLRVTHDYHPSPDTDNLYEVTVTLENISGGTLTDVRYRRNMDWDIYPSTFNECVTIQPDPAISTDALVAASTHGFSSSDPAISSSSSSFVDAPVTDAGPNDHGAVFDFQFGPINAGDTVVFNTYYGATESQPDAEAALGLVGAEAYSFGKPSVNGTDVCTDTPNVFIFAFKGVGGVPIFETASPSTVPSTVPSITSSPSTVPSITTSPSVTPTISTEPTDTPSDTPTESAAPSIVPTAYPTMSPSVSIKPTVEPRTINGKVFLDSNKDGLLGTSPVELGLSGQTIELYCMRSGVLVKEGTTTSAADGTFAFNDIVPGKCRIKVLRPVNYEFSPVVLGGNKVGKDGWSPEYNLDDMPGVNLLVGMYKSSEEAVCDPLHCTNKVIDPLLGYHDCGWGIWNDCTCQCTCDPGVCLSANQKCYDGCLTHLDHNPYGGCIPGVDCPWYPSKTGETHCESSANFAGIHALRETAELCCKKHFSYINQATCVLNSKADVAAEEDKVIQDLARTKYYYPDWTGKKNCVYSSDYDDWMMGANKEHFLFDNDVQCCGTFFPARSDCPFVGDITPKQVDYKPYASEGYFYPHLAASNCRRGRNYPMWMKYSPKHYLYTTAGECCSTWYPSAGTSCPMAEDDGVQEGYFWLVEEAYFPNWKGNGCGVGNDWPEWMADPTQAETHLFKTAKECCDFWFPSDTTVCQSTIVHSSLGKQTSGPPNFNGGTWYPSLNGKYQCIDGTPPTWMTADGYRDEYVFDSHAECCQAHYCADIRGKVQSGNSLAGPVKPGHYPRP